MGLRRRKRAVDGEENGEQGKQGKGFGDNRERVEQGEEVSGSNQNLSSNRIHPYRLPASPKKTEGEVFFFCRPGTLVSPQSFKIHLILMLLRCHACV